MALISKKKVPFPINEPLRQYLDRYSRSIELPIDHGDLMRYDNAITLYDRTGTDTLWVTVFYPQSDMDAIHTSLKKIYAIMKANGDMSVMKHLFIDRVDLCTYANTKPFRVRVVNRINDNFDYFYIKQADASRIYGLELEHLLSPNRIDYRVCRDTLIEEHIVGIPAEQFIRTHLSDPNLNEIRLAKEFVKFNERCLVRLLGDMHSSNFVIDITPDFEEVSYRMRAIDFDQQSYEGKRSIYQPQYFKQNNPIIELGMRHITPETMRQYQREERTMMNTRRKAELDQVTDLLAAMKKTRLSTDANVTQLGRELARYYNEPAFALCPNMGSILEMSLEILDQVPQYYN